MGSDATSLTRDQARSRRGRAVRSLTIHRRKISKASLEAGRALYPEAVERPALRSECRDGPRPCPFVGCRHHLFLDVAPNGSIKMNFPDLEPEQLSESCALDVADRGSATVSRVALCMNVVRERVRQIVRSALIHASTRLRGL